MQTIRIGVLRGRSFRSTDGFHVYGDGGRGQMDWVHPLTSRRELFWPDASPTAGHLLGGHVMGPHLDGVRPDGHLEGLHLRDRHLLPAAAVYYETDPLVFGRFGHAVVTQDAVGNSTTAGVTVYETVINSGPPPPGAFRPALYEGATDRLTLSFSPSERLTG